MPYFGSKNFGNLEMKKNQGGTPAWKKQLYNCKKFWYLKSSN